MDKCTCNHANYAISCTVTECKNHCADCNYCGLKTISIGTHEPHPSEPQCVDCNSFVKK